MAGKQKIYRRTTPMYNPTHPGEVLKDAVIDALGISVTEAARRLQIDRKTLSRILNKRAGITVEMALRLGKALSTSAQVWLGMQQAYDLWQAEHNGRIDLSGVETLRGEEASYI